MELTPCWHSIALVLHRILSVVFLKHTFSIRPSVTTSGSHKRLRFGLWSTLYTIKYFTYLLTYLFTSISCSINVQPWGSKIGQRQHGWRFRVVARQPSSAEHCRRRTSEYASALLFPVAWQWRRRALGINHNAPMYVAAERWATWNKNQINFT